jgi:hypothetical protein
MVDNDLFEPYDRLIEIEVLGRRLRVPENNHLLRCFQFLSLRTISYGDFCWNGDCVNCQFWYREPEDEPSAPERTALSCRFRVREGLSVTRLNPCIQIEGVNIEARDAAQPANEKEHAAREVQSDASHAYQDS